MLTAFAIIAATLFVAYVNGANDNFKGVATLFGSGTTDYKKALLWATLTTGAGSVTAVFFATQLVNTFSGKGLVSDTVVGTPAFLLAVILGAALTVLIATRIGIPISTTHSLIGALAGSGFLAAGNELQVQVLATNFLIPLIASPLIAILFTLALYPLLHGIRKLAGVTKDTCVCIGERIVRVGDCFVQPPAGAGLAMTSLRSALGGEAIPEPRSLDVFIGDNQICQAKALEVYSGKVVGLDAQKILDFAHFLSAGCVSFARGLNDTPKIVALSAAAGIVGLKWNVWLVALVMALGGLLSARRVAETISHRITEMNHGQGFTANTVTALLVTLASRFGLPVSTTHVSCGTLFGIGLVKGKAHWKMISGIVSAWALTLPLAAFLSGILYSFLRG